MPSPSSRYSRGCQQNPYFKLNRHTKIPSYDPIPRAEFVGHALSCSPPCASGGTVHGCAYYLACGSLRYCRQGLPLRNIPYRIIYPGQREIDYRDPSQFVPIPLPPSSPPPTVTTPPTGDTRYFALDDAVRTSLGNARVVRVLAGVNAVSSGRTIYDTAVTNTTIDQAQGRFDPFLQVNNNWDHIDNPRPASIHMTGSFVAAAPVQSVPT